MYLIKRGLLKKSSLFLFVREIFENMVYFLI